MELEKQLEKSGFSSARWAHQGDHFAGGDIECDSLDQINKAFEALSKEADVLMELQDTFWGARYGKLVDKYGVTWDLNYQYPVE